jgi:hypothetical protein
MIAALYVDGSGPYSNRDDVDVWDIERDARKYAGPMPVVAHPPCNTWSILAHSNVWRGIPIGSDGGCFEAALAAVRKYGGVLEHPALTEAWSAHGLPIPIRGCWTQTFDDPGLTTEVSQVAYGHLSRKRTWLYTVGVGAVEMRWEEPAAVGRCGHDSKSALKRLTPAQAIHTPPEFMETLINMAKKAGQNDL